MTTATSDVETPPELFQRGYIINQKSDLIWFVLLPIVAVSIGIASDRFLPVMGVAIAAWGVTVPHHFVTWLRVYGSPTEFSRWPIRLTVSPFVFVPLAFVLLKFAPLALITLVFLWDNQHSIMQQYGLGRVYDLKAKTGDKTTARFDYYLHWILFVNMLIVSPVFGARWPGQLRAWGIGVTRETGDIVHMISWAVTAIYVAVYLVYFIKRLRDGRPFNPSKYEFLFASYFVWYFAAFSTTSVLVWSIAHRIMHGSQYIVMIHVYNQNLISGTSKTSNLMQMVGKIGPTHIAAFLGAGLLYSFFFYELSLEREFSKDFDLLAASLISSFSLLHYFYDSFIWKVRKPETRENL